MARVLIIVVFLLSSLREREQKLLIFRMSAAQNNWNVFLYRQPSNVNDSMITLIVNFMMKKFLPLIVLKFKFNW